MPYCGCSTRLAKPSMDLASSADPCWRWLRSYAIKKKDELERVAKANR